MMNNYNYNYWKINLLELPSKGMFYNTSAIIKCRVLSILDVKFLSTINDITATSIINEILERCIYLENIDFSEILLCDRQYLLFWLRANSFIKNNGYSITVSKCNRCHNAFEKTIKLDDLNEKFIEQMPHNVILPDSGNSFFIKYPTIKDLDIKYPQDSEIERMARYINVPNPISLLLNCSAYDYAFLLSSINEMEAGFENTFIINCPKCGESHKIKIIFSDTGMFGGVKLYDILKIIINITKYTSMQIDENEPWMELEIQEDIVSKMIKEENEEMAKQEAKAKSHVHAPSIPSKARYSRH